MKYVNSMMKDLFVVLEEVLCLCSVLELVVVFVWVLLELGNPVWSLQTILPNLYSMALQASEDRITCNWAPSILLAVVVLDCDYIPAFDCTLLSVLVSEVLPASKEHALVLEAAVAEGLVVEVV